MSSLSSTLQSLSLPRITLELEGYRLSPGGVELVLKNGRALRPVHVELVRADLKQFMWVSVFEEDLEVSQVLSEAEGKWHRLVTRVSNRGGGSIAIEEVRPLVDAVLSGKPAMDRIWWQGGEMDGFSGFSGVNEPRTSAGCLGLTDARGTTAVVLGFVDQSAALYRVSAAPHEGSEWQIAATCLREGVELKAGQTLEISPLEIGSGSSLAQLMNEYGRRTAKRMGRGVSAKATRNGWCSWYYYYGNESQGDILDNVRALAKSPLREHLRVIQIDDGWNLPNNDHPRVWGDWTPGAKFPMGMKALCDAIHDAGFEAGLWLAPFAVWSASKLAHEHPDWLVQQVDAEGKTSPLGVNGNPALHALDLTHPGALQFLDDTFGRVFDEWGYDYAKTDFLKFAMTPGKRHDPSKTTVEAFREGLKRIYRRVGEKRYLLTCTAPMGPCIGLTDAMRIGMDVGGCWEAPLSAKGWVYGNCSVKAAAYPAIFRHWMHGTLWQNDPDCLVVRDRPVDFETRTFAKYKTTMPAEETFLREEEAGFWVRLVWMIGGMGLISEVWDELTPARQQLAQAAFPLNAQPVQWVDWYEHDDLGLMRTVDGPLRVGLFNLGEQPRELAIPASRFGLGRRWSFTERLSGEQFSGEGDMVRFPVLPARCGRVWEMR